MLIGKLVLGTMIFVTMILPENCQKYSNYCKLLFQFLFCLYLPRQSLLLSLVVYHTFDDAGIFY